MLCAVKHISLHKVFHFSYFKILTKVHIASSKMGLLKWRIYANNKKISHVWLFYLALLLDNYIMISYLLRKNSLLMEHYSEKKDHTKKLHLFK